MSFFSKGILVAFGRDKQEKTATYLRAKEFGIEILDAKDIMSPNFAQILTKTVKEHISRHSRDIICIPINQRTKPNIIKGICTFRMDIDKCDVLFSSLNNWKTTSNFIQTVAARYSSQEMHLHLLLSPYNKEEHHIWHLL